MLILNCKFCDLGPIFRPKEGLKVKHRKNIKTHSGIILEVSSYPHTKVIGTFLTFYNYLKFVFHLLFDCLLRCY